MNIFITSNCAWNIINFRKELVSELINQGYSLTVLAAKDGYEDRIKELGCSFNEINFSSRSINPFNELVTFIKLLIFVRAKKPDLILSFTIKPNIYFGIIGNLLKIKIISNITGLGSSLLKQNFISKLVKYGYRISLLNVYKCYFQNKDDMNFFVSSNLIKKNQALLINGSGVDTKYFSKIKSSKVKSKNSRYLKFLYLGRVLEDKGIVEYLLSAFHLKKKLKSEFFVVGSLNYSLVSRSTKILFNKCVKNKSISYQGFSKNVKELLSSVDCLVLPSYREGSSKAILEALAMELPVITTDVPGCNNLVEDNVNGFICKPKSSLDLISKIDKMARLSELKRRKMGRDGRKKMVQEYNVDSIVKNYLSNIKEALSQQKIKK